MPAQILTGARILAAWLVASGLALIVLAVGRELYMAFMVVTLQVSHGSVQLINIVYYTIGGALWLGFFIFIDDHFSKGAAKSRLLKRALRVVGLELSILGLLQLGLLGYHLIQPSLVTLSLTAGEGLLAAGMLYFVYKKPNL